MDARQYSTRSNIIQHRLGRLSALFYYDPAHVYVSGLDPTYLYDKNPALSQLYDRITLGEEEDPGPLIRDRFGARYVFTDNSHDDFSENASASGWFEIVYEDMIARSSTFAIKKLNRNLTTLNQKMMASRANRDQPEASVRLRHS